MSNTFLFLLLRLVIGKQFRLLLLLHLRAAFAKNWDVQDSMKIFNQKETILRPFRKSKFN
uniref:Secreted protein n=1 Tax=Denticeps clupeoides TaxID=299321 RepID=A0AAY4BMQ5_9TELE